MSNSNKNPNENLNGPAAPAAPAAPLTPTTTAVDGYVKFLETLANNKKIENTPTNAKTYADYLTYIGQDPVGDYQAKVRQANLDYAKGLATYGQTAEKMAKSGLVGSGYGEYLTGIAYQGKQSAIGAAQRDAQAAMKQNFASYGDYIEGLKGTNEQTAISGIVNGLLEGDAAKAYAREQGVTEDRLDFVISQTSGAVSEAKAKKTQEQQAILANATSAVSAMVAEGQTTDAAIASLNGVYDDATLAKVKENMQGASATQNDAAIQGATGVTNYKAALDQQKASGAITPEKYDAQVKAGSATNLGFVNALRNDSSKTDGLSAYIDTLKTEDQTGAEVWAEMDDENKGKKLAEWVDDMHSNGVLTTEDYQKYYYEDLNDSFDDTVESSKDVVAFMETLQKRLDNGQISQSQYDDFMVKHKEDIATYGGGAVEFKSSVNWKQMFGTHEYTMRVKYNQGKHGAESIDLDHDVSEPVASGTFKRAIDMSGKTTGDAIAIGVMNGKLAVKYKNGAVYYVEYLNSSHNADFVAWVFANAK